MKTHMFSCYHVKNIKAQKHACFHVKFLFRAYFYPITSKGLLMIFIVLSCIN